MSLASLSMICLASKILCQLGCHLLWLCGCWRFSMRILSTRDRVLRGMPSNRAQSCWLGTPRTLSGEGALKVSITLAAKHLSEVTFAHNFWATRLRFISRADCLHTNFCAACSFDKLILASLRTANKEVYDQQQDSEELPAC